MGGQEVDQNQGSHVGDEERWTNLTRNMRAMKHRLKVMEAENRVLKLDKGSLMESLTKVRNHLRFHEASGGECL